MELREVTDKESWEAFLGECVEKTFLQSWSWGEFNIAMGSKVWRYGIFNGSNQLAAALVIKVPAKRGTFLFVPHGPVAINGLEIKDRKEVLQILLAQLSAIAVQEKAVFMRFSPIWERNDENADIFSGQGFRQAPIHVHPELTWELDISPDDEDILAGMRKTTRYLIRQAEKNQDIEIVKSDRVEDLKLFWPVYLKTAKRHNFMVFPEKYLETEFKAFGEAGSPGFSEAGEIALFLGKYKGEVVSAAIFVFWQDACFYHHSGSLSKYSKIPVSYLLQWEAIKEAKRRGCVRYNFWGITTEANHPWAGLSLFKTGFGGAMKEYVKTQDHVISRKYWLNYIVESIRRKKRGL